MDMDGYNRNINTIQLNEWPMFETVVEGRKKMSTNGRSCLMSFMPIQILFLLQGVHKQTLLYISPFWQGKRQYYCMHALLGLR